MMSIILELFDTTPNESITRGIRTFLRSSEKIKGVGHEKPFVQRASWPIDQQAQLLH